MHGWDEISIGDVYAVNKRIWWSRSLSMILNCVQWQQIRAKDCRRYERMLTDIERDWPYYDDAQKMHDAAELCYLLLGGHDAILTSEKRQARITELVRAYYEMEDGDGL